MKTVIDDEALTCSEQPCAALGHERISSSAVII